MGTSDFYSGDGLEKFENNLFLGWGYNFYRLENQLRADDLLIRSKVGLLLGSARKSIETAEQNYRQEFLPPPSRARPRPDPQAVAGAQAIERLSKSIGALQGQINSQPVPENDRMTERYRQEAETLQKLVTSDQRLIRQAELLRSLLDQKEGRWILENLSELQDGIKSISETLRTRQLLLFPTA